MWVNLQTFLNDLAQGLRNRFLQLPQRTGRLARTLPELAHRRVRDVGRLPAENFVKNNSYGKQIRACVDRLPFRLLRRHVIRRADQRPCLRHAGSQRGAGNAEIHHVHTPSLVQHDVLWFQIPVNDALGMRDFQGTANLRDDFRCFGGFEFLLLLEEAL